MILLDRVACYMQKCKDRRIKFTFTDIAKALHISVDKMKKSGVDRYKVIELAVGLSADYLYAGAKLGNDKIRVGLRKVIKQNKVITFTNVGREIGRSGRFVMRKFGTIENMKKVLL